MAEAAEVQHVLIVGRTENKTVCEELQQLIELNAGDDSGYGFSSAMLEGAGDQVKLSQKGKGSTIEILQDKQAAILVYSSKTQTRADVHSLQTANQLLPLAVTCKSDDTDIEEFKKELSAADPAVPLICTASESGLQELCDWLIAVSDDPISDEDTAPKDPYHRVLLLGWDGAGKTTLSRLWSENVDELTPVAPTNGFNVEELVHSGVFVRLWDVGGCEALRPYWRHYYPDTEVLVYVLDCSSAVEPSLATLQQLLQDEKLPRHLPIVLLANKQDIEGAISAADLRSRLPEVVSAAVRHVLPVSGTDAESSRAAMDTIVQILAEKH